MIRPESSVVAVFDLGSARTKLLTATRTDGGAVVFCRDSRETGLGALLDSKGVLPGAALDRVRVALQELVATARKHEAARSVALATSAFREAENGGALLAALEPMVGPIDLLSAEREGQLFFSGLSTVYSKAQPFAAIDIGGGSVQVGLGSSTASLPLGTFRLERAFQHESGDLLNEIAAIEDHVSAIVAERLTGMPSCRTIVMGSNVMQDFVASAYARFTGQELLRREGEAALEVGELQRLHEHLRGRLYETLAEYFPQNPYFMRGADKALAICLAIARQLGAETVIPTNESVSTAVARLLLSDPFSTESGLRVSLLA